MGGMCVEPPFGETRVRHGSLLPCHLCSVSFQACPHHFAGDNGVTISFAMAGGVDLSAVQTAWDSGKYRKGPKVEQQFRRLMQINGMGFQEFLGALHNASCQEKSGFLMVLFRQATAAWCSRFLFYFCCISS